MPRVAVSFLPAKVTANMGVENVRLEFSGCERGWPENQPYILYDVSKMEKRRSIFKHTSMRLLVCPSVAF